jgi:hypothetical protein
MGLPIYLVNQLRIKVGKKMLVVSAFAYRMPYVVASPTEHICY